jgi:hypothetical protein
MSFKDNSRVCFLIPYQLQKNCRRSKTSVNLRHEILYADAPLKSSLIL